MDFFDKKEEKIHRSLSSLSSLENLLYASGCMNMSACVKSDSASRNPDRAVLIFVRASSLNSLDWSKIRDSSFRSGSKFPSDVISQVKVGRNHNRR